MRQPLEIEAHAKVNLTLEVLGQRSDGYHNLVSIMQTVDLHDTLLIEPAEDIEVLCEAPGIPAGENLALRAARLLRDHAGIKAGARITLIKRIPVASGLGGGSSDAAAALVGLNRLWGAGASREHLAGIGAEIGSDVPFFLTGGSALVQGRGEAVTPLPPAALEYVVILSPDIQVHDKTRTLFGLIGPGDYTRGVLSHKLAGRIRGGGDTPAQFFFNAFGAVAQRAFPRLDEYAAGFRSVGAREITLCGAGPSMFAVPPSREIGVAWQLLLERRRGWTAHLARRWDGPVGADT